MTKAMEKPVQAAGEEFGQCEYVPFGGEDKIKLSFNLILRWLAVKTAKGAVPCEQDLMKFLMVCKAKKLNPFDGDAYLIGYDGKDGPVFSTIVAHQAFLKRAETHPEFDGMESGVIVRIGEEIKELVGDLFPPGSHLLGGWATVFFHGRSHPMTKRLKLSTFDKGRSLWKTNPEGMIVKCAEADALRSSFPQLIGGMYLREEMDASSAQNATHRPLSLQDGRGEEVAFPFHPSLRERPFADSAGVPVNGGRASRYEQDAQAQAVQERIRPKQSGGVSTHEEMRSVDGDMVDLVANAPADCYSELLCKCQSVNSMAAGVILQKEISARLTAKSLTDEQACDLSETLKCNLENV